MNIMTVIFLYIAIQGALFYFGWAEFYQKNNYLFKLSMIFLMPLISSFVEGVSWLNLVMRIIILSIFFIFPAPDGILSIIKKNVNSDSSSDNLLIYCRDHEFLSAIVCLALNSIFSIIFIYKGLGP
jgi:hypothetical protein